MKRKLLFAAIISFFIAGMAAYGLCSSETTNLGLAKPAKGDRNWGRTINKNMDLIDLTVGTIQSKSDDLPEVYIYTGTFNSTTGYQISLPKSVDNVNEYDVKITPTSRGAAIGDIYVTKATNNFTVKCSETNTTDTFSAAVYYIGDVSSYGASIYRKWYVSPANTITDHANASTTGSIAWVQAQISTSQAIMELPGNKNYQIKNNLTLNDNLRIARQMGAIIDTDFSIRDSNYEWYQNGATSEYYLQASGGGNPNINMPAVVIENNVQMADGAAGSLAAGEWDWNDVNSLGYSTVYVRLSDSTDPDGKSADYVQAGYQLTVNSKFDDSSHQAFSGNGIVEFAKGSIRELTFQLWGAKGDGSTDDTNALMRAGHAWKTSGNPLHIIAGDYKVTDSIDFTGATYQGCVMFGDGMQNTSITGYLSAAYPVADFTGSQRMSLSDFKVDCASGYSAQCAILLARDNTGRGDSARLERVQARGIYASIAGLVNVSADVTSYYDCEFYGPYGAILSNANPMSVSSKYATFTGGGHNTMQRFFGGVIESQTQSGIYYHSGADLILTGTFFNLGGSSDTGIEMAGTGGKTLHVNGCRSEDNSSNGTTYFLYVPNETFDTFGGTITGNYQAKTGIIYAASGATFANYYINIASPDANPKLITGGGDIYNSHLIDRSSLRSDVGSSSHGNIIYSAVSGNQEGRADWIGKGSVFSAGSTRYYSYDNMLRFLGDATGSDDYGALPLGKVAVKYGGASTTAAAGDETLFSYTMPAYAMPVTTKETNRTIMRITAAGYMAANANAKTIKLKLGSNLLIYNDVTASPNNLRWKLEADIVVGYALGSTFTIESIGTGIVGANPQTAKFISVNPVDRNTTQIIEVTGDAAAGDITCTMFTVEFN